MIKLLTTLILLAAAVFAQFCVAQPMTAAELLQRGEISIEGGLQPKSLETLVRTSTHIVRGQFADFIQNILFYGYNGNQDAREEELAKRTGMSGTYVRTHFGIPMSEYKIQVDNVLFGVLEESTIVLRKYEPLPISRFFTSPEVERLFFLALNPDGRTFAVLGEASILDLKEGVYNYYKTVELPLPGNLGLYRKQVEVDFVESAKKENFDGALHQLLDAQRAFSEP